MKRVILIHYHEISLKRNNRGWFENRLKLHVQALLRDLSHDGLRRFADRMIITLNPESQVDVILQRLRTVFGVANYALALDVPALLGSIRSGLEQLLENRTFGSFKIEARRGTKDFPMDSQQLNNVLGSFVKNLYGVPVKLKNPDLICYVEIVGAHVYLYLEKIPGGGGLPVRSGGKIMCLLSGGIDSPVASFRLMRRGCNVLFAHFHSFPHTTVESQEKVRQILQILSRYQLESKLYLIPFGDLQREIVAFTPPPLRVLLYRRFMVRIAEALALRGKASALVTGDSLGQVASQTLANLKVVSDVARLPIFRPLIGDDKEDIIRGARQIGTYAISILPDQDCCTLFVPRHPETMARIEQLEKAEENLDISRLVESALAQTTTETIVSDFFSLESVGEALTPGVGSRLGRQDH